MLQIANVLTSSAILRILFILVSSLSGGWSSDADQHIASSPTCDSDIYCYGPLLHVVQIHHIFPDSKTFVDMKMKQSPNETMSLFLDMMKKTGQRPTRLEVELFVNDTFEAEGSEFEPWDPADWKQHPKFINEIRDTNFQEWAKQLNLMWKLLGRKIKDDVRLHPDHYSIIYVPYPVIVPGGRFREFYYWDSYWIVRGLLLSEMYSTVKGMLSNFLSIVNTYGHIPNGGRVYYAMRSQPPMLVPMMSSYIEATNDTAFLRDNIDILEREFDYWMRNHTVDIEKDGKVYTLARYKDSSVGPRPESYREDIQSAQIFKSDVDKENHYSELKAAAESGWDFSSRWFILNGTNKGNLTNLKTRYIIPVELNALIYWNAKILSDFYRDLNVPEKVLKYENIGYKWIEAVTAILWHEEVGAWLDYDMLNEIKRDYFYPTNISPLWTGCYDSKKTEYFVSRSLKYLEKTQIMNNLGGIPTTLEHSGEQWDYPNAWPPLQYIMVMSLDASGDSWAQDLAFEIAERWVRSNFKAFNETRYMFEKYDATVPGGHGSGGEYEVQLGFGWTNGIIMEFLHKYGSRITAEDKFTEASQIRASAIESSSSFNSKSVSSVTQVMTVMLAILATISAGCIGFAVYKKRQICSNNCAQYKKLCSGYTELRDLTSD
ncbi:trehalase [Daktulosphaira vitifoliae]|uniref:trehalase n=1 Tax=Daktulosphaira vitifoliae TaxID=58002 RepID=UPI0021A9BDE4|nr:trehalase [Daktulosphaira vitifoliae]XP_050527396.1 trehalase [Daktulosphaira vitifoliae]XP_050527397.1 trehalase [Daktulosphaira vitifoliae]